MKQSLEIVIKSDLKDALKSKFFCTSVIVFWILTGFVFFYAKYIILNSSSSVENPVELSSEVLKK